MQFSIQTARCAGIILGLIGFVVWSSSGANAAEESCRKTLGSKQAERLVWECVMTETSIHAPCNADNTCSDIEDSIKFGCHALRDVHIKGESERDKELTKPPKFCAKYLAGP